MRRWLGVALALVLVAHPCRAQDKSEDKDDRKEQFKELRTKYVKEQAVAMTAYRKAETAEEKAEAIKKMPQPTAYLVKVFSIVDEDPKDAVSFEALQFAFGLTRGSHPKVMSLLSEHHARSPQMKLLVRSLITFPPPGAAGLLQKVLEDNPDREAKGLACVALANLAANRADKGDEAQAPLAEKYFDRVQAEFGDVQLGKRTLAELAKNSLYELRNLRVGKTAPAAQSEDLKGSKVRLADYRGKVVVLDFWATWCGPCRAMIPHEREMVEKLKDRPFALISVSADTERDTVEKFLAKEPMPWVHWWEGDSGPLLKEWNIRFFPTMYVLDAKGVIRYKNIRGPQLEEAVEKLLAEAK